MPSRRKLVPREPAELERRWIDDERRENGFMRHAAKIFVERFGHSETFQLPDETFSIKVAGPLEEARPPVSPLIREEIVSYMEVLAYRSDAEGNPTAVFFIRLPDVGDQPLLEEDTGELFKRYAPMNLPNKMQTLACIMIELSEGQEPSTVAGVG